MTAAQQWVTGALIAYGVLHVLAFVCIFELHDMINGRKRDE